MPNRATDYEPYDRVTVSYTGYTVEAVVSPRHEARNGWVLVIQTTDYEDRPLEERPEYPAAEEFIVPSGEVPVPGPFTPAWFAQALRLRLTDR